MLRKARYGILEHIMNTGMQCMVHLPEHVQSKRRKPCAGSDIHSHVLIVKYRSAKQS